MGSGVLIDPFPYAVIICIFQVFHIGVYLIRTVIHKNIIQIGKSLSVGFFKSYAGLNRQYRLVQSIRQSIICVVNPALPLRFFIQYFQNAVRSLRMKFLCHSIVGKIFHICIDDFIFPVDHTGAVIAVAYPCIINKIPVPEPFQHLFRLVEFRRRPGRFIILCGGVLHRLIRPVSVDRSVDLYLQFSTADLIVKFIEIEILFSSVFLCTDENVFRIFVQPSAFGPLFQVAGAVGQS